MPAPASPETHSTARQHAERFARVWAIGLCALIFVTYPIWFPWSADAADFPRVTWVPLPGSPMMLAIVDSIVSVGLVAILATGLWKGDARWCWWLVAVMLGVLILLDQQRLQPWAYQSILYAMILASLSWSEGRRWLTAIAVSVYFYSAAGKLDYQFVHTVGNQMVQTLAGPFGGVDETVATKLAFLLPAGELAIALLIALPNTRRIGGVLAIVMHVTLIGLLGPLALGHSWGVLAWNTLLAVQGWVLFVSVTPDKVSASNPEAVLDASASARVWGDINLVRWAVRVLVTLALLMPLLERVGYWDHWTSWALYSPHNSRVEVQIHDTAVDRLPATAQRYLVEDASGGRWSELELDRWSLDRRWVPIYPQGRYQLAFALSLAQRFDLGPAIRVRSKSVADRWTGERHESYLIGADQLQQEMSRYWLRGGF